MNKFFAWFGLPGTFVLTMLMSALALVLALLRPSKHRWLCFAAMALSSIGDLFMTGFMDLDEIFSNSFTIGAVLFMAAHVMYFFTYRTIIKKKGYKIFNGCIVAALAIAAVCFVYFTIMCVQRQNFGMYPLCMIYLCMIISSVSMIFSYTWSDFKVRPMVCLAAIGAVSLYLSDLIIGLDVLAGNTQFNFLIWWLYPIGQILIIANAECFKKEGAVK